MATKKSSKSGSSKNKLKVRKATGEIVEHPTSKVRKVLSDSGFTGNLLNKATGDAMSEIRKVSKQGVVSPSKLREAITKSVNKTNDTVKKTAKRTLNKVIK